MRRLLSGAGWLVENLGAFYFAALALTVAAAIGLCLFLTVTTGELWGLAILALPALWIVMWLDA